MHNQTRTERLRQIAAWSAEGRFRPEQGLFGDLTVPKEEQRVFAWLHSPGNSCMMITRPGDRDPVFAVKRTVNTKSGCAPISRICISESDVNGYGGPLMPAGIYDAASASLYAYGTGTDFFRSFSFASAENIELSMRLAMAAEMLPVSLSDLAHSSVPDPEAKVMVQKLGYAPFRCADRGFVQGAPLTDILRRSLACLCAGPSVKVTDEMIFEYLERGSAAAKDWVYCLPVKVQRTAAELLRRIQDYCGHIESVKRHPAHFLRMVSDAARREGADRVTLDIDGGSGRSVCVTVPLAALCDGADGTFRTERWAQGPLQMLRLTFPETNGNFETRKVTRFYNADTGRTIADGSAYLYKSGTDSVRCEMERKREHGR